MSGKEAKEKRSLISKKVLELIDIGKVLKGNNYYQNDLNTLNPNRIIFNELQTQFIIKFINFTFF